MGGSKELAEQRLQKKDAALDIAEEAGVLRRCDIHQEIYIDTEEDRQKASDLGNKKISDGEVIVFTNEEEMREFIDEVVEESNPYCTSCERMMKD